MKRFYISILSAVLASVFMASCELETSDNGKLDGMWHLVGVDTLSTSGVKDTGKDKLYWMFQHDLLQLDDKIGVNKSILLRFKHSGGKLSVHSPYEYDRLEGDEPVTDVKLLAPYGVNALEEEFTVEGLSGGKMTLRSGDLRLRFRKI